MAKASDPVEELRTTVAGLLEEMAAEAGDNRFRAAAAMIRGRRPGRQRKDDTAALEYAASLITMGLATSIHRACERAAIMFAPSHQVETMRDRLRRKLRTKLIMSEDADR